MSDRRDPLSITFDFLTHSPTASALRILVSALEEPIEVVRRRAVLALLRRRQREGLRALVRAAHVLGSARDLLLEHIEVLLPALRDSIHDRWPQARLNCVELIIETGSPRLSHLLPTLITDEDEEVRSRAAEGLLTFARQTAADWQAARTRPGARAELAPQRNVLLAAAWEAFRSFPEHRRPEVLAALMHLEPERLAAGLRQLGPAGEVHLVAALDLVRSADDPGIISFVYFLLEVPRAAEEALALIRRRCDEPFVNALLDRAELLQREGVRKRLAEAKWVAWLDPNTDLIASLEPIRLKALVRFIAATGLDQTTQGEMICRVMGRADPEGRLAVLKAAGSLPAAVARPTIKAALLDQDQSVQRSAVELLIRSSWPDRDRLLVERLASPFPEVRHLVVRELSRYSFQRYLAAFDDLDPTARELAGRAVQRIDERFLDRLADELHALEPRRRFRALRIIQTLSLERELSDHLLRLMGDPDRVVRATVVRMLGVVRTLEATQAILAALNDPDPRVQANAIDALEPTRSDRLIGLLSPFLRHPNNRVRANAARALIRLHYAPAADVLLQMLEDDSERMRLSAVWTLRHVRVPGAAARLSQLTTEDPSPRVRARAQEVLELYRSRPQGETEPTQQRKEQPSNPTGGNTEGDRP